MFPYTTVSLLLLFVAAPSMGAAQWQPDISPCAGNAAVTRGAIGISMYHCIGGRCWYNDGPTNRWYQFSSEPRIRNLAPGGPAATAGLSEGDVLLAVDGAPITTASVGRHLANLVPGKVVRLTMRRGSRMFHALVMPAAGCRIPGLAVTQTEAWPPKFEVAVPSVTGPADRDQNGWLRDRRRVGDVDVTIYGAPVEVQVDSTSGALVITTPSNIVRLKPHRP